MSKVLPIGTEYEQQFWPSRTGTSTAATIFTYRVVGHSSLGSGVIAEEIAPLRHRVRNATRIWADGRDMWGTTVMRCEFEGDDAHPTYFEQLELCGVEATESSTEAEVSVNKDKLRLDRETLA